MSNTAYYEQLWAQSWGDFCRIGPLTHSLHRLVTEQLDPYLQESAELLDVGCGNGRLLALFKSLYPHINVAGVEGSKEAIAQAPPAVRAMIIRQDLMQGFNLRERHFDVVTCTEVLEHLADYQPALASIYDHLKIRGVALITVPHSMRYWSKSDEFAGHCRRFELTELRDALTGCGLEVVRIFTWGFPMAYIYRSLISRADQSQLATKHQGAITTFIARLLYQAMKLDDYFVSDHWHQLIALAVKSDSVPTRGR